MKLYLVDLRKGSSTFPVQSWYTSSESSRKHFCFVYERSLAQYRVYKHLLCLLIIPNTSPSHIPLYKAYTSPPERRTECWCHSLWSTTFTTSLPNRPDFSGHKTNAMRPSTEIWQTSHQ